MYSYKLLSLVRMLLLGRASVWLDPNCSACHLSEIYFDQGSGILHCCSQDEFVLALLLIITCKWMMFDFLPPSIPVNVVSEANTLFESCCQPIPLLNLFLTTKDLHSDSKNLRHLLPVFIHDWRRYRCLSNVDFFSYSFSLSYCWTLLVGRLDRSKWWFRTPHPSLHPLLSR